MGLHPSLLAIAADFKYFTEYYSLKVLMNSVDLDLTANYF